MGTILEITVVASDEATGRRWIDGSFARIEAVLSMDVEDYYQGSGRTMWIRLHEKGGKQHEVPVHHMAEQAIDAYIERAGIGGHRKRPLWRAVDRLGNLTAARLRRQHAWRMIRRRAKKTGLPTTIGCHTFRASGITNYLLNGGTLEQAQRIAAHSSARTTKLYDHTRDDIDLTEVERIDLSRGGLQTPKEALRPDAE